MPGHCAGLQEGSAGALLPGVIPTSRCTRQRLAAVAQGMASRQHSLVEEGGRGRAGRALQACQRGHERKALHEVVNLGRGRGPERRPASQRREALCSRTRSVWSGAVGGVVCAAAASRHGTRGARRGDATTSRCARCWTHSDLWGAWDRPSLPRSVRSHDGPHARSLRCQLALHMCRRQRVLRTFYLHDARCHAAARAQPQLKQLRQHDRGRVRQVHAGLRAAGRDRAAVRAQRQLRVLRTGRGISRAAVRAGRACDATLTLRDPASASSASCAPAGAGGAPQRVSLSYCDPWGGMRWRLGALPNSVGSAFACMLSEAG